MTVSDESGALDILINTKNFVDSLRNKYLEREICEFLQSKTRTPSTVDHPYDLKAYDGYLLALCNWYLGDDNPNFSFGSLLGTDVDALKCYLIGYLNTRKKVSYAKITERWGKQFLDVSNSSRNMQLDPADKWCYYKEDAWDEKMLATMLKKSFQI